jgi:hypothetical protein
MMSSIISFWSAGIAALISSIVIVPRFSARAIIFFTDASFMSISGHRPRRSFQLQSLRFSPCVPPLFAAGE